MTKTKSVWNFRGSIHNADKILKLLLKANLGKKKAQGNLGQKGIVYAS